MALLESLCRLARKCRNEAIVRVRQIHHQKMGLLLNTRNHHHRFTEVSLRFTRRMNQRHEHLATAQLFTAHIVLHDAVTARETMFFF